MELQNIFYQFFLSKWTIYSTFDISFKNRSDNLTMMFSEIFKERFF